MGQRSPPDISQWPMFEGSRCLLYNNHKKQVEKTAISHHDQIVNGGVDGQLFTFNGSCIFVHDGESRASKAICLLLGVCLLCCRAFGQSVAEIHSIA